MSEAELHVLRGRTRQGLLNKVRRGEVFLGPAGRDVRRRTAGSTSPDDQALRGCRHRVRPVRRGRARSARSSATCSPTTSASAIDPPRRSEPRSVGVAAGDRDTVAKMLQHRSTRGTTAMGGSRPTAAEEPGRRWSGRVVVRARDIWPSSGQVPGLHHSGAVRGQPARLAENRAGTEVQAPGGAVAAGRARHLRPVWQTDGRRLLRPGRGSSATPASPGVAERARKMSPKCAAGRVLDHLVADQVAGGVAPRLDLASPPPRT